MQITEHVLAQFIVCCKNLGWDANQLACMFIRCATHAHTQIHTCIK